MIGRAHDTHHILNTLRWFRLNWFFVANACTALAI